MAGTAMLLVLQPVLAGPMAYKSPEPIQQREEIIVDPPKNITPTIDKITNLTEDQLQDLIDDVNGGSNKTFGKREPVSPRQTAANGAFLSFDGGLEDPNCANFTIDGPFTSIHMFMGSTNIRAITVTSADGTTTTVTGGLETVVDAGEFTFASNERITKLSIARVDSRVSGLTFETDGGNKYEAASSNIQDGTFTPTYTDVPVGAGIMARLRGNKCGSSVFSKLGIDMLDELDSISISNIDYEGFTNNIMPTSGGTQVSVGSQILDNRNSSIEQTISLQTTDAVTRQTTVTAQKHWQVGGSVSLSAKAGIPLIGGTTVTTETNWQVQELSVSPSARLRRDKVSQALMHLPHTVHSRDGKFRDNQGRNIFSRMSCWPILHFPGLLHTVQAGCQHECYFHGDYEDRCHVRLGAERTIQGCG